jgi:hypothetical protein
MIGSRAEVGLDVGGGEDGLGVLAGDGAGALVGVEEAGAEGALAFAQGGLGLDERAFVGTDVAFFDPNFGEYWFPNRTDFARWFGEFFWPKSFYDCLLSGSFALRDYARAVGAGAAEFTGKF